MKKFIVVIWAQACQIMIGTMCVCFPSTGSSLESSPNANVEGLLELGQVEDAAPFENRVEELDEVLVTGRSRRVKSERALAVWLERLRGEYAISGRVEVGTSGRSYTSRASGAAKCGNAARHERPVVQCVVHVTWPETEVSDAAYALGMRSTLVPAVALFGLDSNYLGIRYLQVDSKGTAEGGLGYLSGSTLTTTRPCSELIRDCQRTSRIRAEGDGERIELQIEYVQEGVLLTRLMLVLSRV